MEVFAFIAFIVVAGPLAKAVADRIRYSAPRAATGLPTEVARLREEMDRLHSQVDRLTDEQRFLVRLLSESGHAEALRPGSENLSAEMNDRDATATGASRSSRP